MQDREKREWREQAWAHFFGRNFTFGVIIKLLSQISKLLLVRAFRFEYCLCVSILPPSPQELHITSPSVLILTDPMAHSCGN